MLLSPRKSSSTSKNLISLGVLWVIRCFSLKNCVITEMNESDQIRHHDTHKQKNIYVIFMLARLPPAVRSQLDPALLHALLTCLVAQDAHLVLRTHQEDVALVRRIVVWVCSFAFLPDLPLIFRQILSSVFGYQTHKLDIRHKSRSWSQQAYFLRSLFLLPAVSGVQDEDSESSRIHPVGSHRPRTNSVVFADMDSPSTVPHVNSHTPHTRNSPSLQLPRAIVISGLENTSLSSQRVLAQVLAEKRISLDDFHGDSRPPQDGPHELDSDDSTCLPDDFILVYICLIDPRERPNLHHALVGPVNLIPSLTYMLQLDKFAMSYNVLLKPHIRNLWLPVSSSNPSAPSPTHHKQHSEPSQSHSSSHLPSLSIPALPQGFLQIFREACAKTHLSPSLSLYLADLFSATRQHPQIDGTLLTARCVYNAEKLVRAARVVGLDPTGTELLRGNQEVGDLLEDKDTVPENDELEATDVVGSLHHSRSSLRRRGTPTSDIESSEPVRTVLDVAEVHIARIFPRCVSHRLRVRDGPRDEALAGAVFGATFGDSFSEETGAGEVYMDAYETQPTVKDILISVMSEV